MNSVRIKLIALVLCGIILSSAAIGGASILNSQRVVSADSAKIMNLMCETRSEEINSMFARIEQSVSTLKVYAAEQLDDVKKLQTDEAYVKQYSESLLDSAINAAQNTEGALTVYIRFNPEFTDPESGLFCSRNTVNGMFQSITPTDLSAYDPDDTEHVGWFYEPAKKKTGTWMAPYFNQNINVEMISYVIPIYSGSVLVGVVGMDIDFSVLTGIVENTTAYQTGYAFLTDDKANIVSHKQLSRGTDLTRYNQNEFREMAEQLFRDEGSGESLIQYTFQGEKKAASFRSLQNGMRLVLTAPDREINSHARELMLQIGIAALIIMSAAILFTILYTGRLVRPLRELNAAAKKIADGDLSVSITHHSKDEIGQLSESFRQTAAHLNKYISYINELAYRDSLTGVKNKTAYLEVVTRMDEMTRLKRPQYALIVFDINDLKTVNDTRGHDFGDMLIISACKILCQVFRKSPVYRIGGDEFVVLLEDSDYDHYDQLLEAFQEAVEQYNKAPQDHMELSVARGIAVFSEENDLTYNDVFKRADSAMYRNKAEMKQHRRELW